MPMCVHICGACVHVRVCGLVHHKVRRNFVLREALDFGERVENCFALLGCVDPHNIDSTQKSTGACVEANLQTDSD